MENRKDKQNKGSKKMKDPKNNSEKTHELNQQNSTMTEEELKDLFDWFEGKILGSDNN